MTYDELSNGLLIITGIVATLTFIVGLATIWVGIKANAEKDIKARQQTEKIAEINLKVEEEARKRAEAERQLLELQERVRPRNLTAEQSAKLLDLLKQYPKAEVMLEFIANDAESQAFAKQLGDVLHQAEWKVKGFSAGHFTPVIPTGLFLYSRTDDNTAAAGLQLALESMGIEAKGFLDKELQDNAVFLRVGVKP